LAGAVTRSSRVNNNPLHVTARSSSGTATRYRLTPHARMTVSSLVRVRPPIVPSTPISAAIGITYEMNCGVEYHRYRTIMPVVAWPLNSFSDKSTKVPM